MKQKYRTFKQMILIMCFPIFSSLPISKYEDTNYLDNKAQQDQCWKPNLQQTDNQSTNCKANANNYTMLPCEDGIKESSLGNNECHGMNGLSFGCKPYQQLDEVDGTGESSTDIEHAVRPNIAVFNNPVVAMDESDSTEGPRVGINTAVKDHNGWMNESSISSTLGNSLELDVLSNIPNKSSSEEKMTYSSPQENWDTEVTDMEDKSQCSLLEELAIPGLSDSGSSSYLANSNTEVSDIGVKMRNSLLQDCTSSSKHSSVGIDNQSYEGTLPGLPPVDDPELDLGTVDIHKDMLKESISEYRGENQE